MNHRILENNTKQTTGILLSTQQLSPLGSYQAPCGLGVGVGFLQLQMYAPSLWPEWLGMSTYPNPGKSGPNRGIFEQTVALFPPQLLTQTECKPGATRSHTLPLH